MTHTSALVAGRYRLEGRIAVGAVGEVWRGIDEVLGRPVAVKLLRAEYVQHRGTLARFRSEARHAGSLSHPGIAQVYDYGEAELPYLVMELVDGPSLAGVLASGPLRACEPPTGQAWCTVISSRETCCSARAAR
jgi:serine/threonine protein kinase